MLPSGLRLILTGRAFQQRVNSTNMLSLCECNRRVFSRRLNDGGAVKTVARSVSETATGSLGWGHRSWRGDWYETAGADLAISG